MRRKTCNFVASQRPSSSGTQICNGLQPNRSNLLLQQLLNFIDFISGLLWISAKLQIEVFQYPIPPETRKLQFKVFRSVFRILKLQPSPLLQKSTHHSCEQDRSQIWSLQSRTPSMYYPTCFQKKKNIILGQSAVASI